MLYQMKFGPFMQREILKSDKTKSTEDQLTNKYRKKDHNIKINISIAQNIQYMLKFMFDCVESANCELPKNDVVHQIKDLMALLRLLMLKLDPELLHHVLFSLKNINEFIFDCKSNFLKEIHMTYCTMVKDIVFQQCQQVVLHSWRYYITWIKLLSSIVQFPTGVNNIRIL